MRPFSFDLIVPMCCSIVTSLGLVDMFFYFIGIEGPVLFAFRYYFSSSFSGTDYFIFVICFLSVPAIFSLPALHKELTTNSLFNAYAKEVSK